MQKLLVLLLFVFLSCKEATQTTIPTLGSITESVYASGVIKAENQYTVFATVSGVIQTIDVISKKILEI
ncbi:hypothetical protein AR687_06535 [Flavobacteriaceae bacterium CRH]|nr:hypothetical protein AR687_06535 [Flavobacteriaceae bacterium CRH]